MSSDGTNPYLRDAVLTASPEQLHLMLYDGCIRFATQAREAIENKDYERSFDRLTRARNIISEMKNGLNYDVNPELCERVSSIYGFLYHKLLEANLHRNVDDIDDALRVLRVERETWQILVDKVNQVRDAEGNVNSALDAIASTLPDEDGQHTEGFSAEC
ncbi:MAG: flagellar export chaperone FliS [Planctomycetota bacterium]|jgi:flagellar protein FliS